MRHGQDCSSSLLDVSTFLRTDLQALPAFFFMLFSFPLLFFSPFAAGRLDVVDCLRDAFSFSINACLYGDEVMRAADSTFLVRARAPVSLGGGDRAVMTLRAV